MGTAVVKRLIGDSRAVVAMGSGELATIQQEDFAPGVPFSWLFQEGMEVEGQWDKKNGTFLPTSPAKNLGELADHFGVRSVTLGLVRSLTRKSADISLIPSVTVTVTKEEITGNPLDVINSYLEVGDVVSVRIYRNPEGKIRLRMDDIDDDEPVLEALPILPGGTPWLVEGRDVPWAQTLEEPPTAVDLSTEGNPAPVEAHEVLQESFAPVTPKPGPGIHKVPKKTQPAEPASKEELNTARFAIKYSTNERNRLKDENARLRQERMASDQLVTALEDQVKKLKAEISEMKTISSEARKLKRSQQANKSTTYSRRDRWATDQEWFVEELRRAWIGRYKPHERASNYPLDFSKLGFSETFFPTIRAGKLDDDEIRKVVRVSVDLLTGRHAAEHNLTVHELFEGLGGAQKTRADGALCWRVHLENGAPQAKRLHYWQRRDGVLELGWVANHDDDLK